MISDLLRPVPTLTPEKAVEPAKRWRNRYRQLRAYTYRECHKPEGAEYWGTQLHPTKDIAESKAFEYLSKDPGRELYLGAHPWEGDE